MLRCLARLVSSALLGAGLTACGGGGSVPTAAGIGALPQSLLQSYSTQWKTFAPQGTSGIYNGITWGPGHAIGSQITARHRRMAES
ncbi:MAG: hypothetical protein M3N13_02005 [Candidatus Eremiobacteraeota bacterium]|nr:hypothetical protein [Candidatus Eremiobacteraeota bacterium]